MIEEGAYFDILLVEGNPLEDILIIRGNMELFPTPHQQACQTLA